MEPRVATKKSLWRYHRLLFGATFPRVSRQSGHSVKDKDDNEMVPEAVHRSLGINLKDEENSGKPWLGDRLMNAVRPVIA